jgi:tRNA pseudouridine38-40 synthase
MRNLRLEIEYDGTNYSGWQYQPNRLTIQGAIEVAAKRVLGESIRLYGAARTDAGVHARAQVANFFSNTDRPAEAIRRALNSILPFDIYIRGLCEVPETFHARYGARYKIYEYRIVNHRSPLSRRYAWELEYELDHTQMERAKFLFLAYKDYGRFCKLKVKNPEVSVHQLNLTSLNDELIVEVRADRFLYKQVRRMVGALVDLGRGRRELEELSAALKGLPHRPFITAPAKGLTLIGVVY